MKYLLIILLLFPSLVFCQKYANWKTGKETVVKNYELQTSTDNKTWQSIQPPFDPLKKDTQWYNYTLPNVTAYYRAKATMTTGAIFYTDVKLKTVSVSNSVTITNAKVSTSWWTDRLTWTVTNGKNVDYYWIQKYSGTSWAQVTKVTDSGNRNYLYTTSRGWFSRKPPYRLTPVFKDGTTGTIINF